MEDVGLDEKHIQKGHVCVCLCAMCEGNSCHKRGKTEINELDFIHATNCKCLSKSNNN